MFDPSDSASKTLPEIVFFIQYPVTGVVIGRATLLDFSKIWRKRTI